MGLNRTISQTLDEHSNLRVLIDWVQYDTANEVSYVLGVSVYITLTLFQIHELSPSPEFGARRFKRVFEPCLEDVIRWKNVWVVQFEP